MDEDILRQYYLRFDRFIERSDDTKEDAHINMRVKNAWKSLC